MFIAYRNPEAGDADDSRTNSMICSTDGAIGGGVLVDPGEAVPVANAAGVSAALD